MFYIKLYRKIYTTLSHLYVLQLCIKKKYTKKFSRIDR